MVATDESDLLDDPLFLAAEHRANGLSWKATAAELKMDQLALRKRTMREEKLWRRYMRIADREVLSEAGHEAHRVLRQMLRDEDLKIQMKAAEIHFKSWTAARRHTPKKDRTSANGYGLSCDDEDFSDEQRLVIAPHRLFGIPIVRVTPRQL